MGLSTKGLLESIEEQNKEKERDVSVFRIIMARFQGELCPEFLNDLQDDVENGAVLPEHANRMLDLMHLGTDESLVKFTKNFLVFTNCPKKADSILGHLEKNAVSA